MAACLYMIVLGTLLLLIGGTIAGRLWGLGGLSVAGSLGIFLIIMAYFGFGC